MAPDSQRAHKTHCSELPHNPLLKTWQFSFWNALHTAPHEVLHTPERLPGTHAVLLASHLDQLQLLVGFHGSLLFTFFLKDRHFFHRVAWMGHGSEKLTLVIHRIKTSSCRIPCLMTSVLTNWGHENRVLGSGVLLGSCDQSSFLFLPFVHHLGTCLWMGIW